MSYNRCMTALPQLLAWLSEEPSGAQAQLARRMGIHRATVNKICKGLHRPTLDQAFALERLTGVPARGWARDIIRALSSTPRP
jgi:transcriptional regulator with XRE-family HTH domain